MKKETKKRITKEENIYRVLRVCYNKQDLEHFKNNYVMELRQKKLKPEVIGDIVSWKSSRTTLTKILFLTPRDADKIKGRRYNEVGDLGQATTHPLFLQFMKEIEPYKIAKLFND